MTFFVWLLSLLLVASLKVLQIESLDDEPSTDVLFNADTLWAETNEERNKRLEQICGNIINKVVSFHFNDDTTTEKVDDKICDYSRKLLSLGCFYLEFCGSICEGDVERVLRCWKYLLPIFRNAGRKNYSLEALNLLYQYHVELPPMKAEKLVWS